MPNLRPTELIIILLIIVLLFGAKKLPELAKSIGQSMKIFRAETKTDDPATQQTVNTVSDAPAPAPAAAPAPAPAVPQAVTMNATAAPTTATGAEQRRARVPETPRFRHPLHRRCIPAIGIHILTSTISSITHTRPRSRPARVRNTLHAGGSGV